MGERLIRRLRDLVDVDVSAAADGDALTYDAGAEEWIPGAGGGGGGLPDWWTVDSTPGSENVDFAPDPDLGASSHSFIAGDGVSSARPSDISQRSRLSPSGLEINTPGGESASVQASDGSASIWASAGVGQTDPLLELGDENQDDVFVIGPQGQIGFYGAAPAAQPAAPTTINELVAAMQALGLTA